MAGGRDYGFDFMKSSHHEQRMPAPGGYLVRTARRSRSAATSLASRIAVIDRAALEICWYDALTRTIHRLLLFPSTRGSSVEDVTEGVIPYLWHSALCLVCCDAESSTRHLDARTLRIYFYPGICEWETAV